jgi:hypothetical protein
MTATRTTSTLLTKLPLFPRSALALLALTTSRQVHCFSTAASSSATFVRQSPGSSQSHWFGTGRGRCAATRSLGSTTTTTTEQQQRVAAADSMIDLGPMTPAEKLKALRQKMAALNLDVWLIPTDDPHLCGEYNSIYGYYFV